jgi:hypothetical protein
MIGGYTLEALENYRRSICNALKSSVQVPYVAVSLEDWRPSVARCHENADRWVRANPGQTSVRGWVTVGTDGGTRMLLTHHSVVRGEDGSLFDITPLETEAIRAGMRFVPHDGSESDFFWFKDLFQPFLDCDTSL